MMLRGDPTDCAAEHQAEIIRGGLLTRPLIRVHVRAHRHE